MFREIDEHEWCELPNRLFRARLAKAATSETATDGERKRDHFSSDRSRDAHENADECTGVGSGNEAGKKGAFEREIGGSIVEEQPRGDPCHERDAEREREDEPVEPAAA